MPAPHGSPLLIEREHESAQLRAALASASAGVGTAVALVGPSGIGTTHLARDAVRRASDDGFVCAWGSGWGDGGAPPLWPWQSVLTQLGIDDTIARDTGGSEQERFVAFRAIADRLVARAQIDPVLVVVDDAHDADPGALLLARFLARTLQAAPVLLLITTHDPAELPDGIGAAVDDLCKQCTVIRPAPLGPDGVAAVLRGAGRAPSAAEVASVRDLTGGLPLLVNEVAAAGADLDLTAASIDAVIHRRARHLSTDALEVLATAALLGELAEPLAIAQGSARSPQVVDAALRQASVAGLVRIDERRRPVFLHRRLADAVVDRLDQGQRAALHARIAHALDVPGSTSAHLVAIAHHRLAAAQLAADRVSRDRAVAACRRAATSLATGFAYEAAAQLLARAVELIDAAGDDPAADLLLDVAHAELSAGNLRMARAWFRRAADHATGATELAEAALGLGGIWVHEHRTAAERASFWSLVDRALAALGGDHPELAARLRVRAAAERIYSRDGTRHTLDEAVGIARDTCAPRALAEVLSLQHHTLLGPANTVPQRLALADEVIRAAAAGGDEVLGLMGVLWRAVDLLLAGDLRAERALAEARDRADALQVAAVLFVLDAIDVMRLLRRGHIDAAEAAAQQVFQRGLEIGDADAVGYYGGQLLVIGWLRDQPEPLLPLARQVAGSPSLVEGDVAPLGAAAVLGAMCGERDAAAADLAQVMHLVPIGVETSSNFLITLFAAAEAARVLDDIDTAKSVYAALLPFRHLPILGSLGVVCVGSAERSLGVAARAFGDLDLAVHHFERAVERNHLLDHRVMAAIAEGELGCTLLERGDHDDVERGRLHAAAAVEMLRSFGLDQRADALHRTADRLEAVSPVPDGRAIRSGAEWEIAVGAHRAVLADSVGVRRLVHLLTNPWTDVSAAELAGDVELHARQEVHDAAGLRAYRRRIDELRHEIDDADRDADLARAERCRTQLDELLEQLRATMGIGGRSRSFTDASERARVAVRKSLGRVFDAIAAQDEQLGRDLDASIRTGAVCRFEPVDRFPSVWRTRVG
jgi:tetratricopeptide (TPR) repeat protein